MPARAAALSDAERLPERPLGRRLSTHRAPRSLKLVGLLGAPPLMALGLFMFALALAPDSKERLSARVVFALVGTCFAGLGAFLVLLLRRKLATVVQLYEGGIVELVGAKRREIAWGDVLNFERSYYASGLYQLSVLSVKLRDGRRLNLNSQHLQDMDAIANRLEHQVTELLLLAMRQSLRLDQALSFGKVAASRQGIHFRKRVLPWQDVAIAQVRVGFLEVMKHGDATPTLRVHVSRLQRVDALLTLVNEQRQRAGGAPPFTASASFRRVRSKLWLQSLLVGPLVAALFGAGSYCLYRALRALDASQGVLVRGAREYLAWALLSACLGAFLGLGWWHDVRARLRRQHLAQRLAATGKLVPVLVLEKIYEEWSFHSGYRYRYLTPGGFEATDKVDLGSGAAEPWRSGSDHLLALCSPDERESVLIGGSGYPLSRLPAAPDAF
ncbi:MAG TPA: DUF6585 family protein [Polyangiaceae bacterium]|nr:DUF6585 family protein [Polyangiaceae bacterium]